MSMPFYVSPEQLMKDRADFARKGIARGRSVVVVQYADGILFVAENPSQALHKVSEIYDRIAFAAVGPLQRVREPAHRRRPARRHARLLLRPARRHRPRAGQRLRADPRHDLLRGGEKPYEVEIFVAEVGGLRRRRPDLPAHLRRPVADEHGFAVMGGSADGSHGLPQGALRPPATSTGRRVRLAVGLGSSEGEDRVIPVRDLEVAVLDRHPPSGSQREFERILGGAADRSSTLGGRRTPSATPAAAALHRPLRSGRPADPT